MGFLTQASRSSTYDVIVVGSGAGGGTAAYVLAMEGLKVLMLEAGRYYDPLTETPMFNLTSQAPLRGAATVDKPFGFFDATVDGGWQVPGEPYVSASSEPEREFWWWRARMLGGRTNHWGRISLRNGPYDFKPYSRDGLGLDWPISYEDLAPYYDRTEAMIGVHGTNEGLENTPDSSPGILLPPPAPRGYEQLIKQRCAPLGIPVIPSHLAILTRQLDHERVPRLVHPANPRAQRLLAADMRGRAACFWATPCGRGCSIRANYQSTTVHIPAAMRSGNLDVICDAMVREVSIDARGRATGVHYVDRVSGEDRHVRARAVVLAASGCESARILLNSKSSLFPDGLANGSGKVGRYLMDTVGSGLTGQFPLLENLPAHNEDGTSGMHMYMPWWLYQEQAAGRLDFARGYHVEIYGGRRMPDSGTFNGLERFTGGSYGQQFKQDARRYYGSFIHFAGRGEMIPNDDSYCELDPEVKDRFGIPVLRFHWKWSEHETRQAAHMQKTFAEIIEAMGGNVVGTPELDGAKAILPGGMIIHEVGTTCMGFDAETSVVNGYCQAWEVDNLFVADGGPFVSNADKNPTLSIMALAWRTSDYIVEQFKRRAI